MPDLNEVNRRLQEIERIINSDAPQSAPQNFYTGVDLGTADIVLLVVDDTGWPVAAFLEWAEVVRDGVVLDYIGASDIVARLKKRAEQKLGVELKSATTSYPPGTDPRTSENVLKAAGLEVGRVVDEPSSVAALLEIDNGAVVDIGGGTTGIALVKNGVVIKSADEASGGRHLTLTIAGNQKISFEQAEKLKRDPQQAEKLLAVVTPVFQKLCDIVNNQLQDQAPGVLYFSGGTCCLSGCSEIFENELPGHEIILPKNPLYLTPLAIASYAVNKNE